MIVQQSLEPVERSRGKPEGRQEGHAWSGQIFAALRLESREAEVRPRPQASTRPLSRARTVGIRVGHPAGARASRGCVL